jgi:hypothetical protein
VVHDWGREFHGPEAIRGWSDHFTFEVVGDRVSRMTIRA